MGGENVHAIQSRSTDAIPRTPHAEWLYRARIEGDESWAVVDVVVGVFEEVGFESRAEPVGGGDISIL